MTPAIHRLDTPMAGYVVPGPRSTDAIGAALRRIYRSGTTLPEPMMASLAALDRLGRG